MKVHIKVWTSDLKECETFVFPCHATVRDDLVKRFVADLGKQFPGNSFRTIHIGANRFNVVPQPQANA